MADGAISVLSGPVHELAEALQASGAYLTTAQRNTNHNSSDRLATAVLIEKAVTELTRAQRLFHCLQAHLSESERHAQTPETGSGRVMGTFGPPLVSTGQDNVKRP